MGLKGTIFLSTALFFALLLPSTLFGQNTAEVEVSQQLRFNYGVRPPGGGPGWLEVLVPLNVRGAAESSIHGNSQFVDDIGAEVMLAFQTGTGSKKTLRYYRSQVQVATLPRGRHLLRFYLPPSVVARDRLNGDPVAHVVRLSVGGRTQPLGRNGRSRFGSETSFANFLERIETDGVRNDGILVPIYLSPFAAAYPRETYSFVRRSHDF